MSEVDASHSPIITRDGLAFAKFSPRDRAAVLKDLRKQRRDLKIANLNAAAVKSEQIYAELEAFDDEPKYGSAEFVAHINSDEGRAEALERSYLKANPGGNVAALDSLNMTDGESLALVAEICNLTMKSPDLNESEGIQNPTEAAPLRGYGT
jgi:hypothetical protein